VVVTDVLKPGENRLEQAEHGHADAARKDPAHQEEAGGQDAALRDQVVDTRGPSPGPDRPREAPSRQRPAESSRSVDPALAAAFARELVEAAAAADDGPRDEETHAEAGDLEHDEQTHEVGPETALEGRSGGLRSARNRRLRPRELGGEADPADVPPDEPSPQPGRPAATRRPPRQLRPGARAADLGVKNVLETGLDLGILGPYEARLVESELLRMAHADYAHLWHAFAELDSLVLRAVLVKALAAHALPETLAAFGRFLHQLGEQQVLERLHSSADALPDHPSIRDLVLRYDPMAALGHDTTWRDYEESPNDEERWALPLWLKGLPREPLQMAIVAMDQFVRGRLDPADPNPEGASDALTRALQPHGQEHPSLARWLLNLCARADSRDGLVKARASLLQALNEVAEGPDKGTV